ncbi:MAG: YdcF family protein [bacterium]|nr:YdcF family protein [bacterium]
MIVLIVGIVLLILFILLVRYDPRRFSNALVLMAAFAFLFYGIAVLTQNNDLLSTIMLLFVYVLVPFVIAVMVCLLLYDSILMMKKEGKSLRNLLPGIVALCLVAGIAVSVLSVLGIFKYQWLDYFIILISILCIYFSFTFVALMVYSQLYIIIPKNANYDYIIVHGCGLSKGETVTPLLRGRIDKAVEIYEKSGRKGKLVLSGGQGGDEKISEARAMANYLDRKGYTEDDYELEDKSTTTYENLRNVRDMFGASEHKTKYIFVTNNYHVFRTSIFARKLGMDAQGVGCHTAMYYWPAAFIREYIALQVRYKWGIAFMVLIWAILTVISL